MTYWIGVDEAGYGPNLGPLVICASVWRAKSAVAPEQWLERLAPHFCRMEHADEAGGSSIVIDDSKAVYQSGKGLAALERNVLALAALCGAPTDCADAIRRWVDPRFGEGAPSERWVQGPPLRLPTSACAALDAAALELILAAKRAAGIALHRLCGRILYPSEFNRRLAERDNKSAVLSETTIELVSTLVRVLAEQGDEEVVILCDKHGGRDRYFALLAHFFPDERIEILREGEAESVYRWRTKRGKREIRFCAKAERFPPTAAASMMAKYLRELCMAEWNAFWLAKIPDLKPTAGYPADAKRYRLAIDGLAKELGYEESAYWRRK